LEKIRNHYIPLSHFFFLGGVIKMDIQIILIIAMITVISFVLLFATLIGYWKYKNKKLLFISLVFLFIFIRGLLLSLNIFYEDFESIVSSGYIWLFDLVVLIFLYAAYSVKR